MISILTYAVDGLVQIFKIKYSVRSDKRNLIQEMDQ